MDGKVGADLVVPVTRYDDRALRPCSGQCLELMVQDGAPADRDQKARLSKLSADEVTATELAGEPITAKLTAAPGNGAALGGLKVTTANAWFAARPSGTEDIYKIYAESFNGPEHLTEVQQAAREVVNKVIG